MRASWPFALAAAAVCLLSASFVDAECPNGCSGNGDCMAKDMCDCYKSFQGNDCADRTCLFGRAHVDTPKGDINMDQHRDTADWILTKSQQQPEGTWEYFPKSAISDEAHFYMECSNKGICDRSTGLCACFDGYEGNGCQRTTCPGKCNGHGTCESIRELGHKAGGTLFGREGASGPVKYDLWDGNSTYGCACDPWYFGPDCLRRNCKVGVDPLFLSAGSATYETFVVHAYVAAGGSLTDAYVRLRLFDYYGESYITKKIPVADDAAANTNAANVADAITSVPNLTFRKVKCADVAGAGSLAGFLSDRVAGTLGFSVVCQYIDNPGKMRIPEIAESKVVASAFVVTTSQQGWDNEWFTVATTNIADPATTTGTTLTLTATAVTALTTPTLTAAAPNFVKVGPHILLATAATGTTVTLAYGIAHTLASNLVVMMPPAGLITTLGLGLTTKGVTLVGATKIKVTADPTTDHPVGSMFFFHNAFYTVQKIYKDATPDWWIDIDKPFAGGSADGADSADAERAYKVVLATDWKTRVYNYVSECSGRGMCGYDTGVCTCFKGYTNDNCNTQNILAL